MSKIIGIGTPFWDEIISMSELPKEDGAALLQDYLCQGGGKVATAMVACARLNQTCDFIGVVGDDDFGKNIIKDFKFNNVGTSQIIIEENKHSPFVISLSETLHKDRRFVGTKGTVRQPSVEDVDKIDLSDVKVLHLENASPASVFLAKKAKEKNIVVTYDGDYYFDGCEKILDLVDFFIGSEMFYNAIFDDKNYEKNLRYLYEKHKFKCVVFTFGKNGSVMFSKDEGYNEIPVKQVNVIDTTGAGDVFHGAFIVGYLEGKNFLECCEFSTCVSGIKCTRAGGRTGIPTREVVEKFIKENIIDTSEIETRAKHYKGINL